MVAELGRLSRLLLMLGPTGMGCWRTAIGAEPRPRNSIRAQEQDRLQRIITLRYPTTCRLRLVDVGDVREGKISESNNFLPLSCLHS